MMGKEKMLNKLIDDRISMLLSEQPEKVLEWG